jgi:2-iminobutanoate/2-iminopropanoate deaminase
VPLEVVLSHRLEDVDDRGAVGAAVRGVLDAARDDVSLHRADRVLDAVDDEDLDAAEADAELLVRVAVRGDDGAGLELDHVDHGSRAEQRPSADAGRQLEGADLVEPDELRLHHAIIAPVVSAREEIRVPEVGEPISHYTDAVRAGPLLFVSGCVPVDAKGELVGGDDVVAQARQVFAIMGAILAAGGASFADVVKVTVYLLDVADRTRIDPVRQEVFGATRPASTLVEVSRLAIPGARLEVEAVALIP